MPGMAEFFWHVDGLVIGRTFPLDPGADAHAAIEARTVFGKTLRTA